MREVVGRVAELAYAPVKSMAMVKVPTIQVTKEGVIGDRQWMVVRAETDAEGLHPWVTQRSQREAGDPPQSLAVMALIQPCLTETSLELRLADMPPVAVARDRNTGRRFNTRVWSDVVAGVIDQGDEVAGWLSDTLGVGLRLVKVPELLNRPVSQKYMANDHRLQLQDSYPLHWITRESLLELNQRSGLDLSADRFRPNIVVESTPHPGFEHQILRGSFGEVTFANAKPCDRCPIPLIDQSTGERSEDQEPLRTLRTYKSWRKPDGSRALVFGEMALPLATGKISVGQEVTMTSRRDPPIKFENGSS